MQSKDFKTIWKETKKEMKMEKKREKMNRLSVDEQIAHRVAFDLRHPLNSHYPEGSRPRDRISPRDMDVYRRVNYGDTSSTEPIAILMAVGAVVAIGTFYWIRDSLLGQKKKKK